MSESTNTHRVDEQDARQRRNRRVLVVFLIVLLVLLAILIFRCCCCSHCQEQAAPQREAVVVTEEVVTPPEPEPVVEEEQQTAPEPEWTLDMLTPVSGEYAGGEYVASAAEFNRLAKEEQEKALAAKSGEVKVPVAGARYALNSTALDRGMKELVGAYAAAFLATNQKGKILLEGYTCDLGSDEANLRLGTKRANAMRDEFIRQGVQAEKLEVKSYGESRYNQDAAVQGREANRRVVMRIAK